MTTKRYPGVVRMRPPGSGVRDLAKLAEMMLPGATEHACCDYTLAWAVPGTDTVIVRLQRRTAPDKNNYYITHGRVSLRCPKCKRWTVLDGPRVVQHLPLPDDPGGTSC